MIIAMQTFGITNSADITCFLTQVSWESGGLNYFSELADGSAYDITVNYSLAISLGNTSPGDGPKYKGAGPLQVTGKSNFIACQAALTAAGINIDIVNNPDLARTVQYGFWISCWWWMAHGGNIVSQRQSLAYASICCGRLVNRGNADSLTPANQETQRIAAFNYISSFGDLSLTNPVTPPVVIPPVVVPPVIVPPTFQEIFNMPNLTAAVVYFEPSPNPRGAWYRADILGGTYQWVKSTADMNAQKANLTALGVPWIVASAPATTFGEYGVLIGSDVPPLITPSVKK